MSERGPELSTFEKREVDRHERARAHITRRRETALRGGRTQLERLAALCVLLALVAGVAAGRALARSERSPIRLTVFGAHQLSPEEVARTTGVEAGAAIAGLNAAAIEKRLAAHPRVAKARAVVTSGRLLIEIRERIAVATAEELGALSQPALAVDATGAPFARATDDERERLPRLRVASALRLGSATPGLVRGIELAGLARELASRELEAVEIAPPGDPTGLAMRLRGVAPRFVLGNGELRDALARLETLLDARLPELAHASDVDLRYADQAVIQDTAPDETPPARAAAAI
jgi:cell division septal protein FtsQ